ncbi:MAG: T9SS type A sorting domain-containing protein [Saprospiraceae bacterium]|nr:T9SS type A sorting domain-containing protein [Saprospiraceae bacterium]MBK7811047.1 T9SS type A sorting domain-containing protein [Saprospiraceae bacterium]MBK9630650.1 T9SS type A sorting domain-containing protein [Saprospiraceae bacterium]
MIPKYDYNWILDSYGTPCLVIKFGNNTIAYDSLNMDYGFTNACISDIEGNLIAYTNACQIKNSAFKLMENGDQINPGQAHRENCPADRYPAGEQGAIFIPNPGDSMRYYLIHASIAIQDFPILITWVDAISYSIVDLKYNNGLGKVILKNNPIITDSSICAEMAVVKNINNKDFWILSKVAYENAYYRMLLNSNGISVIGKQNNLGDTSSIKDFPLGVCIFSPNGEKFIRYSVYLDNISLFDFDRSTGLLSNYRSIPVIDSMMLDGGACFSPSGRFLYVGTYWDLYQYDLESNDIKASEVHIAHWDGFRYQNIFSHMFGRMQLGPDCKIYINCRNSMKFLHVINKPDEKGLACDFRQNQLELPQTHGGFLPSFPNYRLGVAPVCDPNLAVSVYEIPIYRYLSVYPNPASDEVSLNAEDQNIKSVQIIDLLGQLVYHQKTNPTPSIKLKLGTFNPGTYIAICTLEDSSILRSKLIVN